MINITADNQPTTAAPKHEPMMIDAFGALPQQASKLPGLGGPFPADDPAYVFKTLQIRPALGSVRFSIALIGLQATRGTLVIRVTSTLMTPGAPPVPVKTVPVLLSDLAQSYGMIDVEIHSIRNVYYALTAHIFDETDATADGIAISLDRSEAWETEPVRPSDDEMRMMLDASAPKIRARPDMVSVAPPLLAWPASQPMTRAQFKEKPFRECMAALDRSPEQTHRNWMDAYTLQVLAAFRAVRNRQHRAGHRSDRDGHSGVSGGQRLDGHAGAS